MDNSHNNGPGAVLAFDFDELGHGIDALESHLSNAEGRAAVGETLKDELNKLGHLPGLGPLVFAIERCAWHGTRASLEAVRQEYVALLRQCSGAALAPVAWDAVEAQQRQIASGHGRKGGRPKKVDVAAQYSAEFDRRKRANQTAKTNRTIYEDIAAESGVVWTTVRDQISKNRPRK